MFLPISDFTNNEKNRIIVIKFTYEIRMGNTTKRVGENKIRCALTEDEIREMGFEIDEIIGNGEATQKFMRVVLKIVEEQENISLENISPMVKAELLSDHSMAITFGGDSDLSFQQLMDAISDLVGQMTPEKMQEFRNLSKEERQGVLDAFLDQKKDTQEQRVAEEKQEKENKKKPSKQQKELKKRQMICALRFFDLDEASRMGRACLEGAYYLIMDFSKFPRDEMRAFAFGAVEYDAGRISEIGQISYIREHGDCIVKKEALQTLMAL